jgi:hypothetical protein
MNEIVSMTCNHPGCNAPRNKAGVKNGKPFYRKKCFDHYMLEFLEKKGFSSLTEYRNSIHPYRYYKKDYCENIDGRLGYTCTTTIMISAQLEVDHIDGIPDNNEESNLQTLCSCCHKYKTLLNEDYKTPGRKSLGIKY